MLNLSCRDMFIFRFIHFEVSNYGSGTVKKVRDVESYQDNFKFVEHDIELFRNYAFSLLNCPRSCFNRCWFVVIYDNVPHFVKDLDSLDEVVEFLYSKYSDYKNLLDDGIKIPF